MTISDLGSLGELVAAIATVATLIYLAAQIRQNTNQLKGESIREINNTEKDLTKDLRQDHDFFVLLLRALSDWDALKPQEQARAHLFIHSYTRWAETCWTLCEQGVLDSNIYDSRETFIIGFLSQPKGGRIWWTMWKQTFDPAFAGHLDKRFEELGDEIPLLMDVPFYAPEHWQEPDI